MNAKRTAWEREVLAGHRWGAHRGQAEAELERLRRLWQAAQPLSEAGGRIADQIVALEICNWRLEEHLPALCRAIGTGQPLQRQVGHVGSVTDDRWRKIWAYYLACRDWLPRPIPAGYAAALALVDSQGQVRRGIADLLGEPTELKRLYVELFCLCLEYWIGGWYESSFPQTLSRRAAVGAVREEIQRRDPDSHMLWGFAPEGGGVLFPCHHKLFRRYDILLSSIGAGSWRGAMPAKGDGPAERVATLERCLLPIQAWIDDPRSVPEGADDGFRSMHAGLGEPDAQKRFLASLLMSLLRSQQLSARRRVERQASS